MFLQNPKILDNPIIIRSHYGDDSIALVQWAYEKGLKNINVVYVDTGFAAYEWDQRIIEGDQHAQRCGFKTTRIISKITFAEAVRGRGEFPSPKFQWCSALLKGLPFIDWIEEWDPKLQAIILIAKRADAALNHAALPEWIEKCEFHNYRSVWHAILNVNEVERNALLERAGFQPLNHRSLECQPCVNSTKDDLAMLHPTDKEKLRLLETALDSKMFLGSDIETKAIDNKVLNNKEDKYLDLFYRGCGNHFGCGL